MVRDFQRVIGMETRAQTVFGARGSANFLSRSTAVLAGLFFLISLGMGMYGGRPAADTNAAGDLGIMAGVAPAKPADKAAAKPAPAESEVPQATAPDASKKPPADHSVPTATVPSATSASSAPSTVPPAADSGNNASATAAEKVSGDAAAKKASAPKKQHTKKRAAKHDGNNGH